MLGTSDDWSMRQFDPATQRIILKVVGFLGAIKTLNLPMKIQRWEERLVRKTIQSQSVQC